MIQWVDEDICRSNVDNKYIYIYIILQLYFDLETRRKNPSKPVPLSWGYGFCEGTNVATPTRTPAYPTHNQYLSLTHQIWSELVRTGQNWSELSGSEWIWLDLSSDCHGLRNPWGSRVGSVTGRVGVEFFWPSPNPYPHHRLAVTREKTRSKR